MQPFARIEFMPRKGPRVALFFHLFSQFSNGLLQFLTCFAHFSGRFSFSFSFFCKTLRCVSFHGLSPVFLSVARGVVRYSGAAAAAKISDFCLA